MMSRRHILGWVAVALIACVIGAAELGLGSHALFSDAEPRDVEVPTEPRMDERQVEERIRLQYDELIHAGQRILEWPQTIILVRVIERDPLTFEVLKSWKGPFSPGRVLHVQRSDVINGNAFWLEAQWASWQHVIQGGDDELLIFTFATHDADAIFPGWGWAGADAQALMGGTRSRSINTR